MGSYRAKQLRRERQRTARRRAEQATEARKTQELQAQAEARRELSHQLRRHVLAWGLWAVATVVAVGHFFEHAEVLRLMSPKVEDLVIGWPTAALLALAGGIVYGT